MSEQNSTTAERVRELFDYDRDTGEFIAKANRPGGRKAGSLVGGLDGHGYLTISVDGKNYKAHRLAWLFVYEKWPAGHIDHLNHDRADNRLENLRVVREHSENSKNQKLRVDNTSGRVGVYWNLNRQKWEVKISSKGKTYGLGYFKNKEDAIWMRNLAEKEFGFHENHGQS